MRGHSGCPRAAIRPSPAAGIPKRGDRDNALPLPATLDEIGAFQFSV
jgi:hypothetical protein